MSQPIKVLYILGWGRSGTTILDNLLGSTGGFFSTGELGAVWDEGFLHGNPCGCGLPVPMCPVWSRVSARLSATGVGLEPSELKTLASRHRELTLERQTWRIMREEKRRGASRPDVSTHLGVVGELYAAIAAVTGAKVIVDSSKVPTEAALLRLVRNVKPYFLHVVRDPRAAAYSWQRQRSQEGARGPRPMPRRGAANSSARWLLRNLLSEAVVKRHGHERTLLLRYEDFVTRPIHYLREVTRLVGEPGATLPQVEQGVATLGSNHAVSGNPSRFRTEEVALQIDTRWRTEQRRRDRLLSTAVALPALRRYGYRIRV